jgi:hypothetical protein
MERQRQMPERKPPRSMRRYFLFALAVIALLAAIYVARGMPSGDDASDTAGTRTRPSVEP